MADPPLASTIPTLDVCRGRWTLLDTPHGQARFAQIMQLNDNRYTGLDLGMESWLRSKKEGGQPAEIFGWSREEDCPDDVLQVLAFTSKRNAEGKRIEPRLRMLGMAVDRIPHSQCCDVHVQLWIARGLVLFHELFGCGVPIEAMRPKTMTFKPMERFHDLARRGTIFQVMDRGEPALRRMDVIAEEDRGHVIHWVLQISEIHEN